VSRAGETDISLTVGSGTISNYKIHYVRKTGQPNTSVKALTKSSKYSISFEYEHDISDLGLTEASVGDLKSINFTIPTNEKTNAFKKNADAELAMAILSIDGNIATIEGTLTNIECRSANQPYLMMKVTSATTKDNNTYTTDDNLITLDIETYLSEQGSSGGTTTDNDTSDYSSDIIVENVYLTDSTGERLDEVTKDSPPFTLVITYAEYGLKEVDDDEFTEDSLDVYLTDAGGFITGSGAKGTLKYLNTSNTDAPRFRASFPNLKYKEGGSTSVTFRSNYNVYGWEINGKANATVNQVDDAEKDKLSPLKPHIIVNQYSYGERQIVAGESFTLNMSVKNTSAEIPLENIVMTISPETIKSDTAGSTTGGLTITSASNTYYIEKLDVGGSFSHAINLRAEPNAAVGSHKVVVQFSFQYVDEVNEKREESSDEENIAIPVTQIDRFSVDPITEIPDVLMAGEDGYITVSFINRGKTSTYNISGVIKGDLPSANQSQHFGNLEAGKAGTLDFEVVGYEPGDMKGEIVMQYEDENAEEIEISLPFSIRIEEQYIPEPPPMDPNEGMEETGSTSTATLVLCIVGGLLMATPIALYLFKRVKAKGIEALDEDF